MIIIRMMMVIMTMVKAFPSLSPSLSAAIYNLIFIINLQISDFHHHYALQWRVVISVTHGDWFRYFNFPLHRLSKLFKLQLTLPPRAPHHQANIWGSTVREGRLLRLILSSIRKSCKSHLDNQPFQLMHMLPLLQNKFSTSTFALPRSPSATQLQSSI